MRLVRSGEVRLTNRFVLHHFFWGARSYLPAEFENADPIAVLNGKGDVMLYEKRPTGSPGSQILKNPTELINVRILETGCWLVK